MHTMKKVITIFIITFLIATSYTPQTQARSGCCSYHGGVCENQCCDGTPLSDICAPFYLTSQEQEQSTQANDKGQQNNSFLFIFTFILLMIISIAGYNIYFKE